MVKIVNFITTEINIISIPRDPINPSQVKIDQLKGKIAELYEDSKVIVTQYPESLIIFDVNNQIGITIKKPENRIIVRDINVTPYSARDLERFTRFVVEIHNFLGGREIIKYYGFNIHSIFDFENDIDDSGEFIKVNFIKAEKFNEADFGAMKSASLRVINYKNNDGRYQLTIEPRFTKDLKPTKSMLISQNAHFSNVLPNIVNLNEQCVKVYEDLKTKIVKLIES
ncbi:MAG: hypothetical protein ACKKMV_02620 [Candidatus Nealsonbacteria bacterium]